MFNVLYNIPTIKSIRRKMCSSCGKVKSRSEFYKVSGHLYRLRANCKSCRGTTGKKYNKSNPEKRCAQRAQRKASKLQATPVWYEHDLIQKLYKKSAKLTAMGIPCHVDHIYPLQSSWVCGLHCFANLRLLSPEENMSKGNRIDSASQSL